MATELPAPSPARCATGRRWRDAGLAFVPVCAGHAAVLWALTATFDRAPPVRITPPAIVGVLVPEGPPVAPPEALPVAPEPDIRPLPVARPVPAREPPLPAPPSARAVSLPPPIPPAAMDGARADADAAAPTAASADTEGSPQPVVPPRADAAFLDNPAPRYPQASRRLREEGRVLLDVFIRIDGTVGEAKLKRSSGFPRLDEAALDAVRRWRYVPAMRGDTAIDYWHVQPLDFELDR